MHKIIASLHKDHIHLSKLMGLLKSQVDAFSSGDHYDLFIMIDIVDYIHRYSDKVHHPKEDVVYEAFMKRSNEGAEVAAVLLHDHQTLPSATLGFRKLLDSVVNTDLIVNREALSQQINDFIDLQTQHMSLEETAFFPLINQTLEADDWDALATVISETDDPLFGAQVIDEYKQLAKQVAHLYQA